MLSQATFRATTASLSASSIMLRRAPASPGLSGPSIAPAITPTLDSTPPIHAPLGSMTSNNPPSAPYYETPRPPSSSTTTTAFSSSSSSSTTPSSTTGIITTAPGRLGDGEEGVSQSQGSWDNGWAAWAEKRKPAAPLVSPDGTTSISTPLISSLISNTPPGLNSSQWKTTTSNSSSSLMKNNNSSSSSSSSSSSTLMRNGTSSSPSSPSKTPFTPSPGPGMVSSGPTPGWNNAPMAPTGQKAPDYPRGYPHAFSEPAAALSTAAPSSIPLPGIMSGNAAPGSGSAIIASRATLGPGATTKEIASSAAAMSSATGGAEGTAGVRRMGPSYARNMDFEDTAVIYSSKSTPSIVFEVGLFSAMSVVPVVNAGLACLKGFQSIGLGGLTNFAFRHTVFHHFCAGETMDEVREYLSELTANTGLKAIVNYAVEDDGGTDEALDNNRDSIIETLTLAANSTSIPFGCLKPTAIMAPSLFDRVTEILEWKRVYDPSYSLESLGPLADVTPRPPLSSEGGQRARFGFVTSKPADGAPEPLNVSEQADLNRALRRFEDVCKATVDLNSVEGHESLLLIDAEHYQQQPAIDHIYRYLNERYNLDNTYVYNTYQLYLRDGFDRLSEEVEYSKANGLRMGAKIVRGAYMGEERGRAEKLGLHDPVHATFHDTSAAYHAGIGLLLDHIDTVGAVVATHNRQSCDITSKMMAERGVPKDHKGIRFAQLLGMSDHISYGLSVAGYNVMKYVPFGPVDKVMPYLVRRVEENTDIFGSTKVELAMLKSELYRRTMGSDRARGEHPHSV